MDKDTSGEDNNAQQTEQQPPTQFAHSTTYQPGDLIAFETSGIFAWFIRLGQRLAHIKNREYTHVAVVVADDLLIQSARKVDYCTLTSWGTTPYVVIPFPGFPANRADVVNFAVAALGSKYGVLSIISRAINCLTPKWIDFNHAGDCDCSTLAARAWEHGGWVCPVWDTSQVMPGQLVDWSAK